MRKYLTWFYRILITAVIFVCCSYVVLFCIKNNTVVDIDLIFMKLTGINLELAIVASFIAGGLLGLLSSFPFWLGFSKRHRRIIKDQKKSLKAQTTE